jgi:hypothetical protein
VSAGIASGDPRPAPRLIFMHTEPDADTPAPADASMFRPITIPADLSTGNQMSNRHHKMHSARQSLLTAECAG